MHSDLGDTDSQQISVMLSLHSFWPFFYDVLWAVSSLEIPSSKYSAVSTQCKVMTDDIKWEMKKSEGSSCKVGMEVNTEGGRETDNTNIVW